MGCNRKSIESELVKLSMMLEMQDWITGSVLVDWNEEGYGIYLLQTGVWNVYV